MTTVNQEMSVEEIERVIAQRVANAIEAIAIYEIKTNMACKSVSQTKQQEDNIAENASNKRKWEGNHNGSSSHQNKGHKVPKAHTTWPTNKKAYVRSLLLVMASKPKTMQYAIKFATKLMDKKISTLAERQAKNNRKHGEKKHYGGSKLLCSKCNYHHDGPCALKCHKRNRVGYLARGCRSSTNSNTANNQRGTGASQKVTCYECGNQGHYKSDCPEQKNQNHENQTGGTGARGVVHAVGNKYSSRVNTAKV
ncbi:putative reverse transcriptase domain, ribonuclease H-like domain, aspartic peptidase domain protein [Tanacetum coccineum]